MILRPVLRNAQIPEFYQTYRKFFKMGDMYTTAVKFYDEIWAKKDPRVDDWFMMSSPVPSIVICIAYVIFVKLGPTIMKDRKPVEMRKVLLVFNLFMVCLSTYCFMEFGMAGWFTGYTFGCEEVDYSTSPRAMRMLNVCWWFYFSKFIELFDTIFFVLRKKFNQCSFLHVFHHAIMPASWWFGVRFVGGGFGTFHSLLNSFIHLMMYTYYFLAALGPKYQKYLWWKKYMTKMQIIQFLLVTIHSVQLLYMKDCNYPRVFAYWILAYAVIFLVMFANFYVQAYRKHPAQVKGKGDHGNGNMTANGEPSSWNYKTKHHKKH